MADQENGEPLDSGNFLFRFRSIKALLDDDPEQGGFGELEKQTIHFARPEMLNDPMEGLTDAYWDGDEVLWENLFRHYALALIRYAGAWLMVEAEEIEKVPISGWPTEADLPTESFRSIYREFCADFCTAIESTELARMLGRQKVPLRRERLVTLLFSVHHTALRHMFRTFKKHRLYPSELPRQEACQARSLVGLWESIEREPPNPEMSIEDQLELICAVGNHMKHQLELGMLSRSEDKARARKWMAIDARFPEAYVDAFLRDLHFTPWRVACFSRRCVNASMWGAYGHEHRGAALVFRVMPRDGKYFFHVRGILGSSSRGDDLEVRPVQYHKHPPSLDSFLEIGMLPKLKLDSTWMNSAAGVPSRRLKEIEDDLDSWRKAHWDKAIARATWKHTDWSHEDEARLIAMTSFTDDPAPNPLTYEFSQLEGVVFGARTTTGDKLRIAEVIERKCRVAKRSDFRFFQAHYSPQKGEMQLLELNLLKFEQRPGA